ncbi:MAG TPA: glycosyl hydrolase 115 family protein, partial [Cyclobacteriaceae bacterium]|nr:glycosyl hydrolase 115 family protein [Cyclobacteriaceae bacterium]
DDKPRSGGYGIYYHFDYVGGPRNYKWLNTSPIIKVWEQMNLAYNYGVDRIWIVNVGDLKPMEFPISFFLDYAWDPKKWNQNNIQEYTRQWSEQQFGKEYADDIADIISKYAKFNGRRKPELLNSETYSLVNYNEAEKVVDEYRAIEKKAESIYEKIPTELKDAYYQLVFYPVKACANLNDMYATIAKNKLYASQGRVSTNDFAKQVKILYLKDSALSTYYNKTLAGGKWNNMMNQIHIGYTYWQQPNERIMPETKNIENSSNAEMGVAVEGSEKFWLSSSTDAILPEFNSYQKSTHYFDIFNRGKASFDFSISSKLPWLKFSETKGTIDKEKRITVSVDWAKAPSGITENPITITGENGKQIVVTAKINKSSAKISEPGFVETNQFISIEAEHYTRAVNGAKVNWQVLPDYGNTLSAVTTSPVTAPSQEPSNENPHLEYNLFLSDTATVKVLLYLGTSLSYNANEGLRLAVSFDDQAPQIININKNEALKAWEKVVEDNTRLISTKHKIGSVGKHILKYWAVDPGVVLQKIVVDAGGVKPSYLGPPESYFQKAKK